jgi:hypothetical protein
VASEARPIRLRRIGARRERRHLRVSAGMEARSERPASMGGRCGCPAGTGCSCSTDRAPASFPEHDEAGEVVVALWLMGAWREDCPHASWGSRTPFGLAWPRDGHAHLSALSGSHPGLIRDGGGAGEASVMPTRWSPT